mmetsp:Transcript_16289/g.20620  ORF Transcript_16289/g.20620 Transcript_16289/m.20620 type:complete len:298 (+) Transcript_16289:192-1085(+)
MFMKRNIFSFSFAAFASRFSSGLVIQTSSLPFQTKSVFRSNYYYFSTTSTASKFALLAPCILLHNPLLAKSQTQTSITQCSNMSSSNGECVNSGISNLVDPEYPGTAVQRLRSVHARVATLSKKDLSGEWEDVRRKILWAGGLKDLPDSVPGQGYTGHSFNDYNHVDLTTMNDQVSDNENDGTVKQIAIGNNLGNGIRIASIQELGPGGSWSTCANGCHLDPPQDVAHIQFRSRIAFKLVWVPNKNFDMFVLVDDDGNELARGKPTGQLPHIRQRQMNYQIISGSKYSKVADEIASK